MTHKELRAKLSLEQLKIYAYGQVALEFRRGLLDEEAFGRACDYIEAKLKEVRDAQMTSSLLEDEFRDLAGPRPRT